MLFVTIIILSAKLMVLLVESFAANSFIRIVRLYIYKPVPSLAQVMNKGPDSVRGGDDRADGNYFVFLI